MTTKKNYNAFLVDELTSNISCALALQIGASPVDKDKMKKGGYECLDVLRNRGYDFACREYVVKLRNAALNSGMCARIVALCDEYLGIATGGIVAGGMAVPLRSHVAGPRSYNTVGDILSDKTNFARIMRDLSIRLEEKDLWKQSAERLLSSGIDLEIDHFAISKEALQGEFYLQSIRDVKLQDFLANLGSIECETFADKIHDKLQELKADVVYKRKESFTSRSEVADWCKANGLSRDLGDRLFALKFDSLEKIKKLKGRLDNNMCVRLGLEGFDIIDFQEKIEAIP